MSPASRVADAMSLKAVSDGSRDDLGGALDGHLGGGRGVHGDARRVGRGRGNGIRRGERGGGSVARTAGRCRVGRPSRDGTAGRRGGVVATRDAGGCRRARRARSFESEEEPRAHASPFARLGVHPIAPRRSADAPSELPALTDRNDGDDASEPVLRRVGRENYRARRRRPVLVHRMEYRGGLSTPARLRLRSARSEHGHGRRPDRSDGVGGQRRLCPRGVARLNRLVFLVHLLPADWRARG